MDVSEKNMQKNTCSKCFLFFDRKYQCKIFNFVDLCSGVGIVWLTTTQTRISDATAITFSVKCFNPLKLCPVSGNIFIKWFASYFFVCSQAFNKY